MEQVLKMLVLFYFLILENRRIENWRLSCSGFTGRVIVLFTLVCFSLFVSIYTTTPSLYRFPSPIFLLMVEAIGNGFWGCLAMLFSVQSANIGSKSRMGRGGRELLIQVAELVLPIEPSYSK